MQKHAFLDDPGWEHAAAQVVRSVRVGGARSQSEIVRDTGLGRGLVATRVNQLQELGLLERRGQVMQGRGRPSQELGISGDAGHLLVASMGASSVDAAIMDLTGAILVNTRSECDIADGPEAVLRFTEGLFDELYRKLPEVTGAPRGVGVAVPGPVEFSTGRAVAPPIMPAWDLYPIADHLSTTYGAPAWVDNDVNVMTLGEWREGVAQGHRDVVFVKVGTGIGAGIIADGSLQRGSMGAAGDIGHIQVTDDRSIVCRCGNVGCLESLAGGFALGRDGELCAKDGTSPWLASVFEKEGHVTAADVATAASHGDRASAELLQHAGALIGDVLSGVVNLLNPSMLVIGGGVAGAGDALLAVIREHVYRRSLPLATRHLVITKGVLGARSGVVGTGGMVLDELLSEKHLLDTARRMAAPARPASRSKVKTSKQTKENPRGSVTTA